MPAVSANNLAFPCVPDGIACNSRASKFNSSRRDRPYQQCCRPDLASIQTTCNLFPTTANDGPSWGQPSNFHAGGTTKTAGSNAGCPILAAYANVAVAVADVAESYEERPVRTKRGRGWTTGTDADRVLSRETRCSSSNCIWLGRWLAAKGCWNPARSSSHEQAMVPFGPMANPVKVGLTPCSCVPAAVR